MRFILNLLALACCFIGYWNLQRVGGWPLVGVTLALFVACAFFRGVAERVR